MTSDQQCERGLDSIVAPDVDYTITDPHDALYDEDSSHPEITRRFERVLASGPYDEEGKAMARRHRAERQEMAIRQSREQREDAERMRGQR